jgi:hypothetical protein
MPTMAAVDLDNDCYERPPSGEATPHRQIAGGKVLPYTLNPAPFYPLLYPWR